MRIAIRVDAATSVGLGHLKRCLSLAQALRVLGAEVKLLTARHDVDVSTLVRQAGFECCEFTPPTLQADARQSVEALGAWKPEWVLVDHYHLDAEWHQQVRESLGTRVATIDDLADRPMAPDVLIDHNFSENHSAKYRNRLSSPTEILGGPRFALLGPAYASEAPYRFRETVHSIGIFMGGTDPINASVLALEACREYAGFKGPIEIATTSANPHFAALKAACARWPDTTLLVDQQELSGFFSRHDLQVGAGGGATWERCCMGVPTLALICADNQKVVVPALHQLGVVETAHPLSHESIGQAVQRLIHDPDARRRLAEASRRLVDGHGASRVALVLLRDQLKVRPARLADARIMFQWRNDFATRRTARDGAEIAWNAHEKWVEASLVNPHRLLLIAQVKAQPVGVIRFDLKDTEAEVSLYLDPALHGLGLGKRLLAVGEASALAHWSTLRSFTAETLEHNLGSQHLFLAAGYKGDHRHFEKVARDNIVG